VAVAHSDAAAPSPAPSAAPKSKRKAAATKNDNKSKSKKRKPFTPRQLRDMLRMHDNNMKGWRASFAHRPGTK